MAPARGRPELWRLGLGLALTAAAWAAVTAPILLLPPRTAEQAVLVLYLFGFAGMILGVGARGAAAGSAAVSGLFGPAGFEPRRFLVGGGGDGGARGGLGRGLAAGGGTGAADRRPPVGGLAAAGAAGGLRAERRRGAGVPRLPAAGAGGAVPVGAGVVAGAVGAVRAPALEPGGARGERLAGGGRGGGDRAGARRRDGADRGAVGGDRAAFRQQRLGAAGARDAFGGGRAEPLRHRDPPVRRRGDAAPDPRRHRHDARRLRALARRPRGGCGNCIRAGAALSRRTTAAEGARPA